MHPSARMYNTSSTGYPWRKKKDTNTLYTPSISFRHVVTTYSYAIVLLFLMFISFLCTNYLLSSLI
jgi:hypothetical protein